MKWGDGTPVVLTARARRIRLALGVIVVSALLVYLSVTADDPCEGKTGQDYQYCVDLNYP